MGKLPGRGMHPAEMTDRWTESHPDGQIALSSISTRRTRFILMGPFPPPVHGLAMVNEAVRNSLRKEQRVWRVHDVAARTLDRRVLPRLTRLPKVARGLASLLRASPDRGTAFYTSVSGGAGKVYELAAVVLARFKGFQVVLHHNSFAYVDRHSVLMRVLGAAAGDAAFHVVVSQGAESAMKSHYGLKNVVTVSNAVFVLRQGLTGAGVERQVPRTIGFLGNISREKGVFEVMELAEELEKSDRDVRLLLAGPFEDKRTERVIRARVDKLSKVEYVGPLYGSDKDEFFETIDILVFPTKYRNEAEPLTVLEAIGNGVPVIGFRKGALSEIVTDGCGYLVETSDNFALRAMQHLDFWAENPSKYRAACRSARRRFETIQSEGKAAWEGLIDRLDERGV